MNALDLSALNAQCIHAVKLMLEAILAAGFLTFIWFVAPYLSQYPKDRR